MKQGGETYLEFSTFLYELENIKGSNLFFKDFFV